MTVFVCVFCLLILVKWCGARVGTFNQMLCFDFHFVVSTHSNPFFSPILHYNFIAIMKQISTNSNRQMIYLKHVISFVFKQDVQSWKLKIENKVVNKRLLTRIPTQSQPLCISRPPPSPLRFEPIRTPVTPSRLALTHWGWDNTTAI